jgi:hypothetical protein
MFLGLKPRLSIACWQLAILGLLVLCLRWPLADFGVKMYVDILAVGRSDFKVLSFLAFLFVLLSFAHFSATKLPPRLPLLNLLMASILLGLGVVEHLSFSSQYFPAPNNSYAQYHNSISSTSLYHIHNSKAVLSFLRELVGIGSLELYDSGAPFLHFHSRSLVATHAFLYVLFIFTSLYQLWSSRFLPLWLYSLIAITSFIVMKLIADGGILFAEGIAAFPLYAAIQCILWRMRGDGTWKWAGPILFVIGLLACIVFVGICQYLNRPAEVLRYTVLVAFLFITCCIADLLARRHFWQAWLAVLLYLSSYTFAAYTKSYYSYGIAQMDGITQIVNGPFTAFVSEEKLRHIKTHPQPMIRIKDINMIGGYALIRAEAVRPFRLWELNDFWSLTLIDDIIQIDKFNCMTTLPHEMTGRIYVLDSVKPMQPIHKSYKDVHFALYPAEKQTPGKPFLSTFRLYMPGCTPSGIAVLRSILYDSGILRSVIKQEPVPSF